MNLGNQAVNVTTRSRNLIPFPYLARLENYSVIKNVAYNGAIIAHGTPPADTIYAHIHIKSNIDLEVGKTYTLSGCPKGGSSSTYRLLMYLYNEDTQVLSVADTGSGKSFTVPECTSFSLYLVVNKNYMANYLTFKPMLNEGSTALPFEPYIQRHDMRVMQNLIDVDVMVATGTTGSDNALTKNEDGSYTLTKNGNSRFSKWFDCNIPAGKYVFLADVLESNRERSYKMSMQANYKDGIFVNPAFFPGSQYEGQKTLFSKTVTRIRFYLDSSEADGTYTKFKNLRLYRLA